MAVPRVSTDAVEAELRERVRERLRRRLIDGGHHPALEDPAVFAEVEALLHRAAEAHDTAALILPELLGDPATWRLRTAMHYQSHRPAATASLALFLKRRVLMPMFRWLFEYSRDNFERQRRVNDVLLACVQELAVETATLRAEVRRLSAVPSDPRDPGPIQRT